MFKTIFITITSTLAVTSLIFSIFLNSILSAFGLAATTIESLQELKASKQVVETMKKRHKAKNKDMYKKYLKRTSKKVSSSAVASVALGTAGVALIVAGLEISYYCDERRELHDEGKILFNTQGAFDNNECVLAATEDSKELINDIKQAVPEAIAQTWDDIKDFSKDVWQKTKDISASAWEKSLKKIQEVWQE